MDKSGDRPDALDIDVDIGIERVSERDGDSSEASLQSIGPRSSRLAPCTTSAYRHLVPRDFASDASILGLGLARSAGSTS
jgi:hypothetical protein